jgi:DNA-binding NarL/FixJ family response regulator
VPVTLSVPEVPQQFEAAVERQSRQASALPSAATKETRVMLVDDHKVMRQGLIGLIAGQPDILIVGQAADGRQALEGVRRLRPDVVVMDVAMPEMDGVEATRRIKAEMPEIRVIGLSMLEDEEIIRTMREAGAESFVSKTASSAELLKAIYGV